MNKDNRILVLGQSGMLAQAITKISKINGYQVENLSKITGFDLLKDVKRRKLHKVINQIKPEFIINAIGITDLQYCEKNPKEAWILHAHLPFLLSKWSKENNIPWVQISTDHFFSGNKNHYHKEKAKAIPVNTYAASKLAGEKLALASSSALVLRTNIIGKRGWEGKPNFAEWVLNNLKENKIINAYTDTWASSIEVNQFALLALKLIENDSRGLMNLASSESISKADLIEKIAKYARQNTQNIRRVKTPKASINEVKRANSMGLDCKLAQIKLEKIGLHLPDSDSVAKETVKSLMQKDFL